MYLAFFFNSTICPIISMSFTINMGKTIINHYPVITIFAGGMVTIPSHGWCMTLFYPHEISHSLQVISHSIESIKPWNHYMKSHYHHETEFNEPFHYPVPIHHDISSRPHLQQVVWDSCASSQMLWARLGHVQTPTCGEYLSKLSHIWMHFIMHTFRMSLSYFYYMYLYLVSYICVYIYISMYLFIYVSMYLCICVSIYLYIYTFTHIYICIYIYVYIYMI